MSYISLENNIVTEGGITHVDGEPSLPINPSPSRPQTCSASSFFQQHKGKYTISIDLAEHRRGTRPSPFYLGEIGLFLTDECVCE